MYIHSPVKRLPPVSSCGGVITRRNDTDDEVDDAVGTVGAGDGAYARRSRPLSITAFTHGLRRRRGTEADVPAAHRWRRSRRRLRRRRHIRRSVVTVAITVATTIRATIPHCSTAAINVSRSRALRPPRRSSFPSLALLHPRLRALLPLAVSPASSAVEHTVSAATFATTNVIDSPVGAQGKQRWTKEEESGGENEHLSAEIFRCSIFLRGN